MSVNTDILVEWDLDNDGDYDQGVEDITSYVLSGESVTGRNWPSMLQGKATPGSLTLRLNNDDDRFSYFNTSSPLATSPFSLQTGRKIRVRTVGSTIADPLALTYDRFPGSGAIGTTEDGKTWNTAVSGSPVGGWTRVNDGVTGGYLEATGDFQIATVDVSSTTGYAQTQMGDQDLGNAIGVVYRWTNSTNYACYVIDNTTSRELVHIQFVAGTPTTTNTGYFVEPGPERFLGVEVTSGGNAIAYLDGVQVHSRTAYSGSGTEWGLYADWPAGANQRPPTFNEFWVWDKMRAAQSGELWQGKVVSIVPRVDQDGTKTAVLKAEGPLGNVGRVTIKPPHTLGDALYAGQTPGMMVGNCLGRAGELHPPETVEAGSFRVGPVGLPDQPALKAARIFEEAEQGFLFESLQGGVIFEAKATRGAAASSATFSDDPLEALNYESFELLDWRREIINRVEAGVSIVIPTLQSITTTSGDTAAGVQNPIDITNPNLATDGAVAGDLVIHIISSAVFTTGEAWLNPSGWRNMRVDLGDDAKGQMRVYAKALAASDVGAVTRFYNDTGTAGGGWASASLHFQNWRGAIEDGLALEINGLGDFPTGAAARSGTHDPPTLFVPWDREPCHFIVARTGAVASTGNPTITTPADNISPDGYGNMFSQYTNATSGSTYDACVQYCNKLDSTSVEDPTPFLGSFTNFDHLDVATIAIRGAQQETVRVDDLTSQTDHNSVITHANASKVFPDSTEADDYADEILARYGDDAPIIRFSYTANKDTAHRDQAYLRRVSDEITVEANNNTGMGISGAFIIESVRHRWDRGDKRWVVTYECAEV